MGGENILSAFILICNGFYQPDLNAFQNQQNITIVTVILQRFLIKNSKY